MRNHPPAARRHAAAHRPAALPASSPRPRSGGAQNIRRPGCVRPPSTHALTGARCHDGSARRGAPRFGCYRSCFWSGRPPREEGHERTSTDGLGLCERHGDGERYRTHDLRPVRRLRPVPHRRHRERADHDRGCHPGSSPEAAPDVDRPPRLLDDVVLRRPCRGSSLGDRDTLPPHRLRLERGTSHLRDCRHRPGTSSRHAFRRSSSRSASM